MRKTAILVSGILLTTFTATLSLADSPFVTSEPRAVQNTVSGDTHPVASFKPVPSSKKQKRVVLAAAAPVAVTTAPSTTPSLLPAVVQADITPHHQKLADEVLRTLPSGCRDHLRNFYVQYTDVKSRGLGGKTTIIIAGNVGDEEFAALLTHECGHVIHSNLMGTSNNLPTAFRDGNDIFYQDSPVVSFFAISWMQADVLRKDAKKADFVSGYAQSDAFEDFAETFAMYILHRDAFEQRAKTNTIIAAKLAWMKTNLPMPANILGASRYGWDKVVPWDVTKLPYTLAAVR